MRKRKTDEEWMNPVRIHPYIERNINCRLSVAARELSEDDSVFQSLYRMTKNTYQNLVSIVFASRESIE